MAQTIPRPRWREKNVLDIPFYRSGDIASLRRLFACAQQATTPPSLGRVSVESLCAARAASRDRCRSTDARGDVDEPVQRLAVLDRTPHPGKEHIAAAKGWLAANAWLDRCCDGCCRS